MARARKQPIPIVIVAGQRGAGKTTLINRLLTEPAFANTAVILNDFGAVALAGAAVAASEDSYLAFGSGCVCCSVRGALTDALENLLRDLDNGRGPPISRVVIEADEAADPSAIFAAVQVHPYLSLRFVPDGIVTVISAATAAAALATRADTVRQLAMADVIAAYGADAGLRASLIAINPFAEVADAATIAAASVAGHAPFDPATDDIATWIAPPAAAPASDLSGEAGRIRTFAVVRERMLSFDALDRFLGYLMALQGSSFVRLRGVVATDEDGATIVDGLGTNLRPPTIADGKGPASIRFTVVTRDLERATFEGYLDAFLGEAQIDTPDRAALTENPLAIAGFSARSGR